MTGNEATQQQTPLYVDLDGTLIASDTLWESAVALAHQRPADVLRLPAWLASGRAVLKRRIAERVSLDPATLPYRPDVLERIEKARAAGRRVVLATASDRAVAQSVAAHLGVFDAVLASDGDDNLKGASKADAIEADAGGRAFEYIGDAHADLPIWQRASHAVVVAPTDSTARAIARLDVSSEQLGARPAVGRAALRALRPHQWLKNTLLFVPLVLDHNFDAERWVHVAIAFACFCACISATYLVNDLTDIASDRQHPTKRRRPFAAGTLPIPAGIALGAGLLLLGLGTAALTLPLAATAMLGLYIVLTTSYSFYFKQQLYLDVLLVAGLYTHRVISGGMAGEVLVSPWLLAFSMFFFVSLAFLKRYIELLSAKERGVVSLAGRGYQADDIGLVESMGLTSGFISVLVIGLYVSGEKVVRMYATPEFLWFICPVMFYWITRIWFMARRGEIPDDPVLFAVTDRASYVAGALIVAVIAVGTAWGRA